MGVDLFVPKGYQGENRIGHLLVLWAGRVGCGGSFPRSRDSNLVFEFNQNALGGFFPDALDLAEGLGVASDDCSFEACDGNSAEYVESGFGTDARHVIHQQPKKVSFLRSGKAIEDMRVFADLEVCEQMDFCANLWQAIVAR
jgi:hypothetical protein